MGARLKGTALAAAVAKATASEAGVSHAPVPFLAFAEPVTPMDVGFEASDPIASSSSIDMSTRSVGWTATLSTASRTACKRDERQRCKTRDKKVQLHAVQRACVSSLLIGAQV